MNGNPPQLPRRVSGYKILLGLFAGLALLLFFAVLVLNFSGENALTRYERQWEAQGEHFDFASFVPRPVPDDQNFAFAPIVASCYDWTLDKNGHRVVPRRTDAGNRLKLPIRGDEPRWDTSTNTGNWAKGSKTNLKGWQFYYREQASQTNGFPVAPQMQTPAADVLLALSKYDAAIEELRQAAARPAARFPLDYDTEFPAEILLPHLSALKYCGQTLQLRAVAELQNGQSDKALADVKLMLRLIASIRTEPLLISHLVRIALLNISLQPVWEGQQDHKWTDAQLVELDREFAKLDFLADYEFSMRGERATSIADIEYLRRKRGLEILFMTPDGAPSSDDILPEQLKKCLFHLIPNSVFYQNELTIAKAHQEWFLPAIDVNRHLVSPAKVLLADGKIDALGAHWSPNTLFARLMLSSLGAVAKKCAYAQNSVDMARVAGALERCRLAQGNYPEALDALSPRFIETLPHDVVGGEPLKYHRTDDGRFTLYSVGWNGTDDGGKVIFKKNSRAFVEVTQGDWVWSGQVLANE